MLFARKPAAIPAPEAALAGRPDPIPTAETHFVTGRPLKGPFPEGSRSLLVGMGCFWGVERKFWEAPGVWVTAVGYAGGHTPNPTYREVCTGMTGHNEVALVVWDPSATSFDALLKLFWEGHDPTQGMRQGNDVGTQYRSGLYLDDPEARAAAERSREAYQQRLTAAGYGAISTEIVERPPFFYAEEDHQQYLARNPGGYCGVGGTGVTCPAGVAA
jgi:peptide-methionine (S)-S-oxide reductase